MHINYPDNTPLKDSIKNLWREAFGDTEDFLSAYFGGIWQGKNAFAMLESNRLIGALELVPYTLSHRGANVKTSYIVGVSTTAEARHRGVATALMRAALEEQKKRGEVFSLLIPFSYPFYEKMGYATCYDELSCQTAMDALPLCAGSGKLTVATINDLELLNQIYNGFCKDKNGYVVRTQKEWQFIFDFLSLVGGQLFLYRDASGNPIAYISFLQNKKRFRVLEAAFTDTEGLSALTSFAALQAKKYKSVDWLLPAVSPLPKQTGDTTACQLLPSAMARIVDVPKALTAGLAGLKISVTDDFCYENSGVYEEKQGLICLTDKPADIETDIGSLTQLVMGYRSAAELSRFGKLTANADAISKLDTLYPKQTNYINFILRDV